MKRNSAFMYIGLAIIIVEVLTLAGIHIVGHAQEQKAAPGMESAITIQEAPPIDVSEKTDTKEPVYKAITVSEDDAVLLEQIIWAEANNQCFKGQKACLEVIFNRVLSDEWPDTIYDVLSQRGQFATWKSRGKAKPTEVQSDVISEVLRETETVLPDTSYVFFDTKGKNGRDHVKIQDHVFGR